MWSWTCGRPPTYSGKKYAQASTNALSAIGYDMDKVVTLEGGFTAWTETYPDNVE